MVQKAWKFNGIVALLLLFLLMIASFFGIFFGISGYIAWGGMSFGIPYLILAIGCFILFPISLLMLTGLTIVQPNEAKVILLFGKYKGVIKESGLWFTWPLTMKRKVTLRVCNFNSNTLKVNDIEGNPIEIAAVIVYKVVDPTKALLEVEAYESFVEIQSETALRHVATRYPYDSLDDSYDFSLRANTEEIAQELSVELQDRLAVAGVQIIEARLTHLAYATEIASAMLQRQQASAILSARQKIVEGAVGMAQMAIVQLEADGTIELDEERKMVMINNLLVAIVSDRGAQPIINTGSLY